MSTLVPVPEYVTLHAPEDDPPEKVPRSIWYETDAGAIINPPPESVAVNPDIAAMSITAPANVVPVIVMLVVPNASDRVLDPLALKNPVDMFRLLRLKAPASNVSVLVAPSVKLLVLKDQPPPTPLNVTGASIVREQFISFPVVVAANVIVDPEGPKVQALVTDKSP